MSESIQKLPAHIILSCNGLACSVWGERIIRAERRGGFLVDDVKACQEWDSCACGEASNPVARVSGYRDPEDDELATAGISFDSAVRGDEFECAARLLVEIERRAADCAVEAGLAATREAAA